MISYSYNFLLILCLTVALPQILLSKTVWTTYAYENASINGKRVDSKSSTELTKPLVIKTRKFAFYECQIDSNIAVILKENSTLRLTLKDKQLEFQLIEGEVLIKISKLKSPLKVSHEKNSLLISDGEFKITGNKGKTLVMVRKNKAKVHPEKGELIELRDSTKVVIENGNAEPSQTITATEMSCLNDLKDVIFFNENELANR